MLQDRHKELLQQDASDILAGLTLEHTVLELLQADLRRMHQMTDSVIEIPRDARQTGAAASSSVCMKEDPVSRMQYTEVCFTTLARCDFREAGTLAWNGRPPPSPTSRAGKNLISVRGLSLS